MNPERWKKLEESFHAALEREGDDRSAFVIKVCHGDDELRRELESMLDHHEQAESFIESPAYEIAAESILDGNGETLLGKALGSYEIVGQLARRGMGEDYLETDKKLPRKD